MVFQKTSRCRYYPRCHLGDSCRFAHSSDELRPRPNLTKTRMCAGYADGRCRLPARKCGFAHGERDLRPRETPVFKDPPNFRRAGQRWEREATPPTPSTADGSSPSQEALGSPWLTEDLAASNASLASTPQLAGGWEGDPETEGVAAVSYLAALWVEELGRLGEAAQGHIPAFFATQGECEAALEMSMPEVYED